MVLLNGGTSVFDQVLLWLIKLDQALFVQINTRWTNTLLDSFFPVWRESITWAPLYLFLLLFITFNFGARSIPWILLVVVTITITDQVSSSIIKEWIGRPRPCRDPDFLFNVRLLMSRCPLSGSFTSSHATNHFGAAVFLSMTLKPYFKKWTFLFYIWAFTVCYGQAYVGVHYPLDLLGGALLGSVIGYLAASFFNRRIGLPQPDEDPIATRRI